MKQSQLLVYIMLLVIFMSVLGCSSLPPHLASSPTVNSISPTVGVVLVKSQIPNTATPAPTPTPETTSSPTPTVTNTPEPIHQNFNKFYPKETPKEVIDEFEKRAKELSPNTTDVITIDGNQLSFGYWGDGQTMTTDKGKTLTWPKAYMVGRYLGIIPVKDNGVSHVTQILGVLIKDTITYIPISETDIGRTVFCITDNSRPDPNLPQFKDNHYRVFNSDTSIIEFLQQNGLIGEYFVFSVPYNYPPEITNAGNTFNDKWYTIHNIVNTAFVNRIKSGNLTTTSQYDFTGGGSIMETLGFSDKIMKNCK